MKKKIMLLTGSSGGIGSGIVKYFTKCNVIILGISRKNLSNKKNYFHYKFDLNNFDEYENLIKSVVKKHGKIDYFVHAAGIQDIMPMKIVEKKIIYKNLNINFISPFLFIKSMKNKRFFKKKSSATIISSVMSELGDSGLTLYSSSKAACLGLVKSSAIELSKDKIRVNSISPGTINNKMFKKYKTKVNSIKIDELRNKYPLGFGTNMDINLCLEYLISQKNNWLTGQNIILDGGFSIR